MHDAELNRLHLAARDHRIRAALAREEAAVRGFGWWGHALLQQSADYYERRASEVDEELRRLTISAPPAADRRRTKRRESGLPGPSADGDAARGLVSE